MPPNLATTVPDVHLPCRIAREQQLLSLGSCFSDHIALRLLHNRFKICANPNGVLYNPAVISRCIRRFSQGIPYNSTEILHIDDSWVSFDHHGKFTASDLDETLNMINKAYAEVAEILPEVEWLLLTFGTAFAWYHRDAPEIAVANCHKISQDQFERRLLHHDVIAADYQELIRDLRRKNPQLKVLITISPVRHLRQNPMENTLSKSHLIIAAQELANSLAGVEVFPSYEIMLDELRDYRFYDRDLVHPNELAVDIIWERFCKCCLDSESQRFLEAYGPVLKAMHHRPLSRNKKHISRFTLSMLAKVDELSSKYPKTDFTLEREHFRQLRTH